MALTALRLGILRWSLGFLSHMSLAISHNFAHMWDVLAIVLLRILVGVPFEYLDNNTAATTISLLGRSIRPDTDSRFA